jgi:hypothetical protein
MTIKFTTAFTESPVVEFEYSVGGLQSLFDDYQNWKPNLDLNGLGYDLLTKRLIKASDNLPGAEWSNFNAALENSKRDLVEKFLKIDTEKRWPNIPTQISNQLVIYKSLVADMPGYKMNPHIDNRSVYAAGYLNVFDNNPVTVLSTQQNSTFGFNRAEEYHAPGKKGIGAIWLNTDNSWHWVNTVSQDRKIIMITFQIVPWN